jgi:hypothetical protein
LTLPAALHRRYRPAFFAGLFTDFLVDLLAGTAFFAVLFAGAFLTAAFLAASFAGAFWAGFFAAAFLIDFFAGAFFVAAFFRAFFYRRLFQNLSDRSHSPANCRFSGVCYI